MLSSGKRAHLEFDPADLEDAVGASGSAPDSDVAPCKKARVLDDESEENGCDENEVCACMLFLLPQRRTHVHQGAALGIRIMVHLRSAVTCDE